MNTRLAFETISALLVDCDGTLIDSLAAWDEVEKDILKDIGPLSEKDQIALHSSPMNRMATLLHETYGIGASTQDVIQQFDNHMLDYYRNRATAMPYAQEFLQTARAAGVPIVVVSSSPQRYLRAGFETSGLMPLIDVIVSTEDDNIAKEDPAIYLSALAKVDASLEQAWGIDDAPYAISAMNDTGLKTVGVYEGSDSRRIHQLKDRATIYAPNLSALF